MVFKRFGFALTLRVALLALLLAAFFYCYFVLSLSFSSLVLLILAAFSVTEIVRYVNRTNREMAHFLEAIKYHDFSNRYPESGSGKAGDELHKAFNLILGEYRKLKFEKEIHASFLNTLVESVPVGILCSDHAGKIILYNKSARSIIGLNHLPDLDILQRLIPELHHALTTNIVHRPEVVRLQRDEQKLEVSVRVMEFRLEDRPYRLATLQNIKGELEIYEVEAWQKLIRVLTHEIMNSVTPISSLSSTLLEMLADNDVNLEDIREGMTAIRNRSQGLLNFVEHYRTFTRIPDPSFSVFSVSKFFGHLQSMYQKQAVVSGIMLSFNISEEFELTSDEEQLEQVMINLINNAFDAVRAEENPEVVVKASLRDGRPELEVRDNGHGIDPGYRDKIFVPFFTTKENGSGIGLSLSRQILLRNKATISFKRGFEKGTAFIVRF